MRDEYIYEKIIDESIKTVVVEEPPKTKKKNNQNIKIDAVLKYLPKIMVPKSEIPIEMKI